MKLRLMQKGFETYNGQMGVIFFENGLSTADVKVIDAVRMAAVMLCEWEDGSSPSVAQSILDNANTPAPMPRQEQPEPTPAPAPDAQPVGVTVSYTEDQLAAIADKEGIKGLRVIAEPLGIKSNSISELIVAILKVAPAAPKAE